MAEILKYKLELFGGPKDMAVRYYRDLATALRVGNGYLTRNREYPEKVGYEIHATYSDFTTKLIAWKQV